MEPSNPQDPFPPVPLFAFPLFSTTLGDFDQHRKPLVDFILDVRKKYPGVVRSNRRSGWHSGPEMLELPNEHFAWLIQKMLRFVSQATGRFHGGWANYELEFASCWANVLGLGGWNAPHHHYPCVWSAVCYIQTGPHGNTPDDPSGCIEFMNPNPWQTAFGRSGNLVVPPKEGRALIFPSTIYHFVHPHEEPGDRISVAFNYNVVPKRAR